MTEGQTNSQRIYLLEIEKFSTFKTDLDHTRSVIPDLYKIPEHHEEHKHR